MENFFNKVFKNSTETVKSPETVKSHEQQLDPEKQKYIDDIEKYSNCRSYDGNFALERESWLRKRNSGLESYIYNDLVKKDAEEFFSVKSTVDSFYENNNFDVGVVMGSFRKPVRDSLGLKNLYWENKGNKKYILEMVRDKKLASFNEQKIKKVIGEKELERITKQTEQKKERLRVQEEERAKRLKEFKDSGKDKDPLMASDINFSVLDIHGSNSNSENPPILELQSKLPENLSKLTINVKQIEGKYSKDEYNDETYNEGGFFNIADTSGYLPPKALESIIQKDKKSAVLMYGGHLKLCFASAFNQIKSAASDNSPQAVDIHVPLDMCYDAANQMTDDRNLPIIPDDNSQFELYKDQEILSVGEGVKDENPRSRIYLWSNSERMLDSINTQNRLDTVRNQINTTEQ